MFISRNNESSYEIIFIYNGVTSYDSGYEIILKTKKCSFLQWKEKMFISNVVRCVECHVEDPFATPTT